MISEQIQTLIETAKQAWEQKDVAMLMSLFADDGELIVPGTRSQGKLQIQSLLEEFAATNDQIEIEIHHIIVAGNRAMLEWTWRQTNSESGKVDIAEDAIAVDIQDGKIIRWREYIDDQTPDAKD
ncbi:MAG: nuclear transport factor 2 family protein [Thainema sp.]